MNSIFQPGDVVQLKSGGPSMTVETLTDDNSTITVHCSWFEKSTLHEKAFNEKLLRKYKSGIGSVPVTRA